ncbi:hypothetical protein BJN34_34365 [Cupriavidus necator]|uniref:Uncharacterized protein n=1 Tax=Cupriavidus necator TaxID=106590 RepID=A0A1U9V3I9_CUPNE|nr:hypothetical protein [Cupriavidus necator]AQV98965.1 hypothetical protein BJN34_34365 [Cupriavidus necator]
MLTTQYNTFIAATTRDQALLVRGSNIRVVDFALESYWHEMNGARDAGREIACLSEIVTSCLGWLKLKRGKAEDLQAGISPLFVTRRQAIANLGSEALQELYVRLTQLGVLTPDLRGRLNFDRHKLSVLSSGVNAGIPSPYARELRPMGADYQNERLAYLQSGKIHAISGSGVHQTHKYLAQMLPADRQRRKQAKKIARKEVHALTLEDFQVLDAIGRMNLLSGDVNYLAKYERMKYMAIVGADGLLHDVNDQHITTHPYKVTAYAMDKYGSLFIKDADPLGEAMFFNHSSFNAGNDVICAGTLTVRDGSLRIIDNNSGHYKPTRENLHNCLSVLASEGLACNDAIVNLYVVVMGEKQELRYTANQFLRNPNVRPKPIIGARMGATG